MIINCTVGNVIFRNASYGYQTGVARFFVSSFNRGCDLYSLQSIPLWFLSG